MKTMFHIIIGLLAKPKLKLVAASALLVVSTVSAQTVNRKNNIGLVLAYTNSNNGLGSDLKPAVALQLGANTLVIGPNIQKRNLNLSGFRASYERVVCVSNTGKSELYFFGSAVYHPKAYLSKRYVKVENSAMFDKSYRYDNMRLTLVEAYGGFGFNRRITNHLSASLAVGVGVYHTLDAPVMCHDMIRDNSAASIFMKSAITYKFKKQGATYVH